LFKTIFFLVRRYSQRYSAIYAARCFRIHGDANLRLRRIGSTERLTFSRDFCGRLARQCFYVCPSYIHLSRIDYSSKMMQAFSFMVAASLAAYRRNFALERDVRKSVLTFHLHKPKIRRPSNRNRHFENAFEYSRTVCLKLCSREITWSTEYRSLNVARYECDIEGFPTHACKLKQFYARRIDSKLKPCVKIILSLIYILLKLYIKLNLLYLKKIKYIAKFFYE